MKTTLTTHPDHQGSAISLDLSDVSTIEQYGQRDSAAGYVSVKITFKSGSSLSGVKMAPADYDQLVLDWNPEAA